MTLNFVKRDRVSYIVWKIVSFERFVKHPQAAASITHVVCTHKPSKVFSSEPQITRRYLSLSNLSVFYVVISMLSTDDHSMTRAMDSLVSQTVQITTEP